MRGCLDDRITYKGFNYKELDEAMFNVQVETEAYKAALKVLSLSDSIYIIMVKTRKATGARPSNTLLIRFPEGQESDNMEVFRFTDHNTLKHQISPSEYIEHATNVKLQAKLRKKPDSNLPAIAWRVRKDIISLYLIEV
jgi:hypothetical protein